MSEDNCTCWYGAYVKPAGGTGFGIARFDPKCPVHFLDVVPDDNEKDEDDE